MPEIGVNGYIVNREGEVADVLFEGDSVKIIRKQASGRRAPGPMLIDDKIIGLFAGEHFTKIQDYQFALLSKEKLSAPEWAVVALLLPRTKMQSGLIAHSNNKHVSKEWVKEELKDVFSESSLDHAFSSLKQRGIIARVTTNKEVKWCFNPYIAMKGSAINASLYDMFKNTKWFRYRPIEGYRSGTAGAHDKY